MKTTVKSTHLGAFAERQDGEHRGVARGQPQLVLGAVRREGVPRHARRHRARGRIFRILTTSRRSSGGLLYMTYQMFFYLLPLVETYSYLISI